VRDEQDVEISEIVFVYDADGSVVGEVRYWVGTLFGAEHCSLCDVTHTRWGRRKQFVECADRLGIPITYLHRDHVPADVLAIAPGWPCVIGRSGDELRVLLGPAELAAVAGDVARFERSLRSALLAA
jgi:hypothetical protein